jgi:hypothetical protein
MYLSGLFEVAGLKASLGLHGLVGVSRVTVYAPALPHSLHVAIGVIQADIGIQVLPS